MQAARMSEASFLSPCSPIPYPGPFVNPLASRVKESLGKIEARQLFTSIDCLLASVNSVLLFFFFNLPLVQRVELILFLSLWHFIIGLGKAILLVLLICTLIYSLLFLFSIPLHSLPCKCAPCVFSYWYVLQIVALCACV